MKKPKPELDPDVADDVPWSDNITPYDDQHTITYFRLLGADVAGSDWQEVARSCYTVIRSPSRSGLCIAGKIICAARSG